MKGTITVADLDPFFSTAQNSSSAASSAAATTSAASSSDIVPVAVGIAVPLAVLLIAALVACGFLYSQVRKLRKEKAQLSERAEAAAAVSAETHYGRQSAMSAAPTYEFRKQVTNTNWEPFTPQPQSARPHGDYNHYTQPPTTYHSPPYNDPVEVGDGQITELAAHEVPKP